MESSSIFWFQIQVIMPRGQKPKSKCIRTCVGHIKFPFARAQTPLGELFYFGGNFKEQASFLFKRFFKVQIPVHFKSRMGVVNWGRVLALPSEVLI